MYMYSTLTINISIPHQPFAINASVLLRKDSWYNVQWNLFLSYKIIIVMETHSLEYMSQKVYTYFIYGSISSLCCIEIFCIGSHCGQTCPQNSVLKNEQHLNYAYLLLTTVTYTNAN